MEKALKILNTFILLLILGSLVLIYLKLPQPFTLGDYRRIQDLEDEQRRLEINKIPMQRIYGEITGEVEVARTVYVRGEIDCY
jgi:hypothetical protein